jgi:hypothetical protein
VRISGTEVRSTATALDVARGTGQVAVVGGRFEAAEPGPFSPRGRHDHGGRRAHRDASVGLMCKAPAGRARVSVRGRELGDRWAAR